MKIRQMQYFIEVCKNKSITVAAKNLHIAQPSISAAIKEMETELEISLFRRYNKKLYLTKDGEYVLNKITPVMENLDKVMTDLEQLSPNKKCIALGLPLLIGAYLMPAVLGNFHDSNPDIKIEVVEVGGLDSIELLEKEELDLTVTARGEHFSDKLDYIELFKSEYCLCVHKNHTLSNRKFITVEDIKDIPVVMLKSGFFINDVINKEYSKYGCAPNVLVYTKQLHTIKNLVTNNIAGTFLLKESVIYDDDVIAIPFKNSLEVSMGIVTKKGREIRPDTKKLIKFLIEEAKNIM